LMVVVGMVACVAASCAQPSSGEGPAPACPVRQEVSVEQSATQDFSQVRAISSNGQWVVSSRIIAAQYELTVRHVGDPTNTALVGHLPYSDYNPPFVAVTDDGSTVLYSQVFAPIHRWHRSTGTSDDLPMPMPAAWFGRVPTLGAVLLTGFSADGSSAFWHAWQGDFNAFGAERVITDTTTGEITHERRIDPNSGAPRPLASSPDGRFYVERNVLVDTATGQERYLDALGAYFGQFFSAPPLMLSPSGRFFVYLLGDDLHLWDNELETGVLVETSSYPNQFDVAGVGDDGRLAYSKWVGPGGIGPGIEIIDRGPDGTSTVTGPYLVNLSFQASFDWSHRYLVGTPDLRSVVLSRQLPPSNQSRLAVLRCL
jgi:hypothetical protein